MTTLYLLDEQGTVHAEDGLRDYTALTGRAAYLFMTRTEHGSGRFFRLEEPDGTKLLEIEPHFRRQMERLHRRERYVKETRENSGLKLVSWEETVSPESGEGEALTRAEVVADETVDVEQIVMQRLLQASLHRAVRRLDPVDRQIICGLFLDTPRATQVQLGLRLGLTQSRINQRKKAALIKLRYFL